MSFDLRWTEGAAKSYAEIRDRALTAAEARKQRGEKKTGKAEGLFKQIVKCADLLGSNPRHAGLQTHEFHSIEHPYKPGEKVFEAYVQNRTPGAYRLFWCYGPGKGEITVVAITPHP